MINPSPINTLAMPTIPMHRAISTLNKLDYDNVSEMTGITRVDGGVRTEREVAQLAFKKAIRRGRCTLKELIDHFYVIEERHMIE